MSQIISASKPGYDVLTETDPDNLNYSSDYNTLKYYAAGSASLTTVGLGTATLVTSEGTISHGLGYAPFFICYVNDFINPGGTVNFNIVAFDNSAFTIIRLASAYVDSSNLYLRMWNASTATYTATFYYKIYRNNLGL